MVDLYNFLILILDVVDSIRVTKLTNNLYISVLLFLGFYLKYAVIFLEELALGPLAVSNMFVTSGGWIPSSG